MAEPAPDSPRPDVHAASASPLAIKSIELKAAFLLGLIAALVLAFVAYLLVARGTFEPTQNLILTVEDAEGVTVGSNLYFSGFAIGRVRRIDLAPDGNARIEVAVPRKDAHWLRESSIFTLERGLVGSARLRAITAQMDSPALADDAVRPVLRGDASAEIPALVATARNILSNVEQMTGEGSDLRASMAALRATTEHLQARLTGRHGVLGAALGNDADAQKLVDVLSKTNALLESLAKVSAQAAETVGRIDARVLGRGGLTDEAQATMRELTGALADARATLRKADGVIAEVQKISANTAVATEDLVTLRAEVEASLRRLSGLIDEINRRWPFARESGVKLP